MHVSLNFIGVVLMYVGFGHTGDDYALNFEILKDASRLVRVEDEIEEFDGSRSSRRSSQRCGFGRACDSHSLLNKFGIHPRCNHNSSINGINHYALLSLL